MSALTHEKFYTAGEIAKLWRVSTAAVLAAFRGRSGVFRPGMGKKSQQIRVPENVLRQVMEERGYVAHDDDSTDD